jgi:hypothetical protein
MTVIAVPKTPKDAYDPNRAPGTLLQNHLKHLEWAVRSAAERAGDRFTFKKADTEAEAAARIEALTRQLQAQMNRPPIHAGKPRSAAATVGTKRGSTTTRSSGRHSK